MISRVVSFHMPPRYHPAITGTFVAHCHILTHEDIGMMQELRIRNPPGPIR